MTHANIWICTSCLIFVSTCDVEHSIVSGEGTVLPLLTFPVYHNLHDLCPQRDVSSVDGYPRGGAVTCLVVLAWDKKTSGEKNSHFILLFHVHWLESVKLCLLTHCVPHIDIALASPIIALREGLPIREHIAFLNVCTLSKAIIIQPGGPVVHVARMHLSIGCSEKKETTIIHYLKPEKFKLHKFDPSSYIPVVLQPASLLLWLSLISLVFS